MCLCQKICHFQIAFWAQHFSVYFTMLSPRTCVQGKRAIEEQDCCKFDKGRENEDVCGNDPITTCSSFERGNFNISSDLEYYVVWIT